MGGATKFLTPAGGSVQLEPASNIATDVVVKVPSRDCTLASEAFASQFMSFRNRIINGAMLIDMFNNGATASAINWYACNRWLWAPSQTKFNYAQNLNSVAPPHGFATYMGFQVTSAFTPAAGDYFQFLQHIEGFTSVDFAWGTQSAKAATLSFWVYSSLTGTFGGSILNGAGNRSYPFSYTISQANTWTYITLTVPGDTSGTWGGTTGIGISLRFSLGHGANFAGTANAWQSGLYVGPAGCVNVASTNGATFYITGVQFEKGTEATPFEVRPYAIENVLCQRYTMFISAYSQGTFDTNYNQEGMFLNFPVAMRSHPTVVRYSWNKVGHIGGSNTTYPADNAVLTTPTSLVLRWSSGSPAYRSTGYYGSVDALLSAEL